ncbi:hypothetical protein H5410_000123 [Solanum commersonii]|uniref:Uncharacterized protein n=1 Tax=Solanum commersonii TaxID=4109 RepID=A0A9J6AV43_SOLCO|nr:hypothetical protein H5410_000123 [Solanum commersonii]
MELLFYFWSSVTIQTVKEAYDSWGFFGELIRATRRIWEIIPATIFWCIWTEKLQMLCGVSTLAYSLKLSDLSIVFLVATIANSQLLWSFVPCASSSFLMITPLLHQEKKH